MANAKKTPMKEKNGAIKSSLKRTQPKRKSVLEKQIGTTSGATQRKFAVAQFKQPFSGNTRIQVDKCLQIVNRRIYRQHKVYRTRVGIDDSALSGAPGKRVQIFALKNNWANRKAFALAKEMYDKAVSEERAQVGNARWQDFRISTAGCFVNAAGALPVSTAVAGTRNTVTLGNGEYGDSTVTTTDSNGVAANKTFNLEPSSSTTSYSVFLEFANNGPRTPTDPGAVSPGGYERVSGTSYEDGNVQDLLDNGNFPPYDTTGNQSVLSGGPWVKVGELFHNPNGASVLRTDYFDAPLGIIVAVGATGTLDVPTPIEDVDGLLTIEVKDGDYKGVAAEDI
jgi:hypothetical protein